MANSSPHVILEGPFSVETPDTSGEVLIIKGADISDLQTGRALVNCEHINPEDMDEKELDKSIPEAKNFKGYQVIVGRVLFAKKIFSKEDCDNDRQLQTWNKFKKPMIYGAIEIWDGPDAHENARALASLARLFKDMPDGPRIGLSVEGKTIDRSGNMLNETVISRMAATLKPANRTVRVNVVDNSLLHKTTSLNSFFIENLEIQPIDITKALDKLKKAMAKEGEAIKKTLTAGIPSGAPGSRTQGEALQSPDRAKKISKIAKALKKKHPKSDLETMLSKASDEQLDKAYEAIKHRDYIRNLELTEACLKSLAKK